jgi:hypothetical protein
MSYQNEGTLGGWTFYRWEDHTFTGEFEGRPLYGYVQAVPEGTAAGRPDVGEWYPSLEHAMAAAIAEKYTGRRGAGGTGVGTAADWFMRMIGVDQLQPAGDVGTTALSAALVGNGATADRWTVRRVEKALEGRGVVLAHVKS